MLIYIAGPYTPLMSEESIQAAKDENQLNEWKIAKQHQNILLAEEKAIECWEAGHSVICPHLNTNNFDNKYNVPEEIYTAGYIEILARCDAVVLSTDNYETSSGTKAELAIAESLGIPVYTEIPSLHPTEIKNPIQCHTFIRTIMKMYRIHLNKNADYSSANVLGTGRLGIVVRLWDKIIRIMNLNGFNIQINKSTFFQDQAKEPKNESLIDSWYDAAVYSIIGILFENDAWGK